MVIEMFPVHMVYLVMERWFIFIAMLNINSLEPKRLCASRENGTGKNLSVNHKVIVACIVIKSIQLLFL